MEYAHYVGWALPLVGDTDTLGVHILVWTESASGSLGAVENLPTASGGESVFSVWMCCRL